jgi:hypothetical protein
MQKKKFIHIAFIILTMLIFFTFNITSCKDTSEINQLSGDWNVIIINDTNLNSEELPNGLPFIRFDTLKSMISGNAGCNSFSADASYAKNIIEVGEITATLKACENMKIEEQLFKTLNNQTVKFNFDADTLIITNDLGDKLTLVKDTSS